jgi:hypothetical protein
LAAIEPVMLIGVAFFLPVDTVGSYTFFDEGVPHASLRGAKLP